MRKTLLFLVFSVVTGAAQAQIKCWTGADGKRACGDAPPAGAKVTTIKTPSSSAADPAPAAKDAKGPPLTAVEKEAEAKKKEADAKKAAEKTALEEKNKVTKAENCERAKAALRPLESGQRVARTNAQGERYFLDDAQVAQELANVRKVAQDACGS